MYKEVANGKEHTMKEYDICEQCPGGCCWVEFDLCSSCKAQGCE